MWDRHPVSLSLMHMLPDVAELQGVALAPLLNRAGIGQDLDANRIVARAQISTLLQELSRRAGAPTIGLDLAASADPNRLGLAGQAFFAGRTLRECLSAHQRHIPTLQGGVQIALEEWDGRAYWRHTLQDSDATHAGVLNEGVAAFVVATLRAISGAEGGNFHISLPHRARAPVRAYEDKLGVAVSFGAGAGVVVDFDAAWLDRPNLVFGGVKAPIGEAPSVAGYWQWRDDGALMAALERIISAAALAGTLSLLNAAHSLGLSPRSLQRRLAALGTSFETQVDAWRRDHARQHLAGSELAVGTIARLLGYRDPAHFIRAFRRWEGRAPLAWRRAVMARNGN
ncbi:AraC family transcriptional regulator [Chelatococcus asaccharovorans]|uniref:AraC family transcriptional regulator n=1 Tax=Chelatococcus asaccharovorans TaxID=28210 RepID=UPI00224C6F8F|nr:AraC family transcriptional regulator [Chelatococcus asaccharovorans]CAH1670376.1 AraC family transcriptional regulator [Chelatococcus asaccharovorans]CAH1678160.1 AraC family transcriptional regulator [Chelatococcus asaccharovorans]